MAYKTILVHASDDPAAEGRIDFALCVGRLFGAALFGVAAEAWCPFAATPEYSYVPVRVLEDLERESLQRLEAAQSRFATRVRDAGADSVCEGLESLAARRGADLIVVGGYGHSRWRESVFGGVTQGFLDRGVTHVLLSH